MKSSDYLPRRSNMLTMSKAELAILAAIGEIELIGADTRLTKAQMLLQEARDLVADYIDELPVLSESGGEK